MKEIQIASAMLNATVTYLPNYQKGYYKQMIFNFKNGNRNQKLRSKVWKQVKVGTHLLLLNES